MGPVQVQRGASEVLEHGGCVLNRLERLEAGPPLLRGPGQ